MNSINDVLSQKAQDIFFDDIKTSITPPIVVTDIVLDEVKNENVNINLDKNNIDASQVLTVLHAIKNQVDSLIHLVENKNVVSSGTKLTTFETQVTTGEKIIEGVFDGEKMIGSDGEEYAIPQNYASKSKLVEGDMMKLTITKHGSFVFKQIGPIERKRLTGEMITGENGQWNVLADGRTYKILTASATFYKAKSGDQVMIFVPKSGESDWAAVDNIIHL